MKPMTPANKVPAIHGNIMKAPTKSFGDSVSAPDTNGSLRRARQMLAGIPTAVRTSKPKMGARSPRLRLTAGGQM